MEILMPALSPTMEEGTLAKWLVKEGDSVTSGQIIAEIETDKATMEFEAADDGMIGKLLVAEGTAGVKVNTPIAMLTVEGETISAPVAPRAAMATPMPTAPAPKTPPAPSRARVFASPLARRIAAGKGLDLSQIAGSGPHGRIIRADVEASRPAAPPPAAAPAASVTAPAVAQATAPQSPDAASVARLYEGRSFTEVPLDGMRRTVAARLTEAKQTIPHFYLRREVRLDALLDLRGRLNTQLELRGAKLSVNDFIIKACAIALQAVPDANAVWAGDRILRMRASDVAVAVAVEGGLFVPVLHDAETKTLSALSAEMKDLATRARARKLAPADYQGGSFAISNLGMMGIDSFDAVINPPHGAILAVGAGVKKPVVTGDQIGIATAMTLTLSVDHRVIDGALGAELLAEITRLLENPLVMLA